KVNSLEKDRSIAMLKMSKLSSNQGMQSSRISEIEANLKDFKLRYENESKKLGLGDQVKIELEKIRKLQKYIVFTLKQQEDRALQVLQIELNNVLAKYLTKHYQATIDSKDYQIKMLDSNGREVGESTGEGHVLKFAFISTIVALAGRKTLEKIDFMAEPTIAPLVLDAPFSVLDPAYQGSVAKNLADQTNQLVLLLSSAAWPSVENSLNDFVGKRYVLISKQSGSQGQKPIKEMKIGKRRLLLNEYDADRDESVIEEI
ncbi:MAG: hypothetical protein KKA63_10710, partial [Gammaproteobacteria bacterium]|nr:hypothetical protein [Gammaproteobacteria bacterium]